jgi:chemotaxis protein methyltransferase CheR
MPVHAEKSLQVVAPRYRWDPGVVIELLRRERFSEAMELLQDLPPESSMDPDALLLRAVILTNSGDLAHAEKACRELLESNELNSGAHYLMALCREHAGDLPGALDHDQTAAYLDPGFAMPHLHLGLLAKRRGNLETARKELGQALILLTHEDVSRILLFGGGFSREALVELSRVELRSCGGNS